MYMPDELCWLVPMSHHLPKRVARKQGAYATRRLPYGTPHVVEVVDQKLVVQLRWDGASDAKERFRPKCRT